MLQWQLQAMLLKTAWQTSQHSTADLSTQHGRPLNAAWQTSQRSTACAVFRDMPFLFCRACLQRLALPKKVGHISEDSTGRAALRGRPCFKYNKMHFMAQFKLINSWICSASCSRALCYLKEQQQVFLCMIPLTLKVMNTFNYIVHPINISDIVGHCVISPWSLLCRLVCLGSLQPIRGSGQWNVYSEGIGPSAGRNFFWKLCFKTFPLE